MHLRVRRPEGTSCGRGSHYEEDMPVFRDEGVRVLMGSKI